MDGYCSVAEISLADEATLHQVRWMYRSNTSFIFALFFWCCVCDDYEVKPPVPIDIIAEKGRWTLLVMGVHVKAKVLALLPIEEQTSRYTT